MKTTIMCAVSGLLSLAAASSDATLLTFEIDSLANYAPIPPDHGDHVSTSTPNVDVEYSANASYYASGYGDLVDVVWGTLSSTEVVISLIADSDSGFSVLLNSFDLAVWGAERQTTVRITADKVVTDLSTLVSSGAAHVNFITPDALGNRIDISFDSYWFGIDNINFDQRAIDGQRRIDSAVQVAEPGSFLLLGAGLLGFGFARRKRSHLDRGADVPHPAHPRVASPQAQRL